MIQIKMLTSQLPSIESLDEVRSLKNEAIHTVERFAAEAYGSKEAFFYGSGRGHQQSNLPSIGIAIAQQGYRLAVRVFKIRDLELIEQLKRLADGALDIREIGIVKAQSLIGRRMRPIEPGVSISHASKGGTGTLGCFVRKKQGNSSPMILSCNHVLAHEDDASLGDPIIQPGNLDEGKDPRDRVATLTEFISLQPSGNEVDAAIAEVQMAEIRHTAPNLPWSGVACDPTPELRVSKRGRTTGTTVGKIRAIELVDFQAKYRYIKRGFDNVIEIESSSNAHPFSRAGDSGSVIVNEQGDAIGLLIAGSQYGGAHKLGLTYAVPMTTVLESLDLELVT